MTKDGKRKARAYSPAFKAEALRLIEAGGVTIAQIARELGVHEQTLHTWRRQAKETERGTDRSLTVIEEENRRLRRENARLREEREILKKATAFFARTAP
jgi:transposase